MSNPQSVDRIGPAGEARLASFAATATAQLAAVGAHGHLHARHLSTADEVGLGPDEPIVTASVFKIAVLLELYRQAAAGELDVTERIRVGAGQRVFGPTGLSVFADDAELSLRDLAGLMISVSDNTATDIVLARVGLDRVNASLCDLGLHQTLLTGSCADLLATLIEDLGLSLTGDPNTLVIPPDRLAAARALNPATTTRSTPREITSLLAQIWNDSAAVPTSCEAIRRTLALQVWGHGLRAGLAPDMSFAGKSGTLPGIRNEAGVITGPAGHSVAVAVFVRFPTDRLTPHRPDIDRLIADLGRLAVDVLTQSPP